MSTVDLMILGALMKKPMNAYELKKEMELKDVKKWIKISSSSVYKNLVILYKKGLINGENIKEGEMPEKIVYTINEKGKEYFMQLMKKYSEDPGNIYIDFAAFIANLRNVDKEIGIKMISNLQNKLFIKVKYTERVLHDEEAQSTFVSKSLIQLYLETYKLFYNWSEEFKKSFFD